MEITLKNCTVLLAEKVLFEAIDFSVKRNDFIRIKGRNGVGKTIFLHSLLGIYQDVHGEIHRNFKKKDLCYITENPFFFDNDKVSEVLATLSFFYGQSLENIKKILLEMDFDVRDYLKKDISNLSKGMKKKLMLIPLFFEEVHFFVLDEIFTGLDSVLQGQIADLICRKYQQGATILFVEHNESIVDHLKSKKKTIKEFVCQNQKISLS